VTDTLRHGLFSWADVAVPEPSSGKAFYTELFGWTGEDLHHHLDTAGAIPGLSRDGGRASGGR